MRAMLVCLWVLGVCGCDAKPAAVSEAKGPVVSDVEPGAVSDPNIPATAGVEPTVVSAAATPAEENLTPAQLSVDQPVENRLGMVLVPIPAGTFLMGSSESEAGRDENEQPQEVHLTKSFYLGRTEVTQGQWEAVMGSTPWRGRGWVREGADYSATFVNWHEASEFCRKLSESEGVEYRLPTEAEWEYACRAGATTAYSFGDDASQLDDYAWYEENAGNVNQEFAHAVGEKKPNSWGLYDMHGNVAEWCADWYGTYSELAVTDPVGPSEGSERVLRGGGWYLDGESCRAAARDRDSPDFRHLSVGFRVLRSSDK